MVAISKSPAIPTVPLALISAVVVVPVTSREPAIVVLPELEATVNLSLLIVRSPDVSMELKVPCIGTDEPMEIEPDLILTLFIVILEKSISLEAILLVSNFNLLAL